MAGLSIFGENSITIPSNNSPLILIRDWLKSRTDMLPEPERVHISNS